MAERVGAQMTDTLKILSLNVHGWVGGDNREKIGDSVCTLVRKAQPDVCCFQEVMRPLKPLHQIAGVIGAPQENVFFTPVKIFGNAMVSRYGGVVEDKKLSVDGREIRHATKLLLETGNRWSVAVINLHLDHQFENVRIKQIQAVMDWLKEENEALSSLPHLIVGDFNAVSHWTSAVTKARKKHNLQPSTDEFYRIMTETYGYLDLEFKRPPRNTSVYNVRVDYIFCSPALSPRIFKKEIEFEVIPSRSDHSAVMANLKIDHSKRIIGIISNSNDVGCSSIDLERLLTVKGLGGRIEVVTGDVRGVFAQLESCETVIVEGSLVKKLLPSLDVIFEVATADEKGSSYCFANSDKLVAVSCILEMVSYLEKYFKL